MEAKYHISQHCPVHETKQFLNLWVISLHQEKNMYYGVVHALLYPYNRFLLWVIKSLPKIMFPYTDTVSLQKQVFFWVLCYENMETLGQVKKNGIILKSCAESSELQRLKEGQGTAVMQ